MQLIKRTVVVEKGADISPVIDISTTRIDCVPHTPLIYKDRHGSQIIGTVESIYIKNNWVWADLALHPNMVKGLLLHPQVSFRQEWVNGKLINSIRGVIVSDMPNADPTILPMSFINYPTLSELDKIKAIYHILNPSVTVTHHWEDEDDDGPDPLEGTVFKGWSCTEGVTMKDMNGQCIGQLDWEDIKLHLKPLSTITDEDFMEVVHLCLQEEIRDIITDSSYINRSDEYIEMQFNENDYLILWFDFLTYGIHLAHEEFIIVNVKKITDLLISKGYNLDFKENEYIAI